jgi:TonB-linked SusC/RagA family outer membrane protein
MKRIAPALLPVMGRGCLFVFLLLFFTTYSRAQTIRTGTVTDAAGKGIVSATVQVKGGKTAATTDSLGRFSINAPANAILVISSIGYANQEISVANKAVVDIVLVTDARNLNEVLVTALGIRREARRLGYAATSVNTEQLTTNRTTNFGNSLEGKVAGVNVSPPAGGPGGSTKIRIRGQSTFSGDNSPLIVVNGIPINNTSVSGGGSNGNGTGNPTGGSSDQGDGLQSINQDDIESMTVLKGAAAAALYGFRATNGAIIITTRSGNRSKDIGVEVGSHFQAEQALDYTDFQYQYGQGENGVRPVSVADAQTSGVYSFGEKLDGKPSFQFDGTSRPYVAYKNRIKDFYRTGTNFTNSVALSGGNDKGYFRLSFANTDANSIMPNSDYHKKIVNLGMFYKFTPKLSLQLNANYSNEYNHNPPQIGIQDLNANTTIYTLATSIAVPWLKTTYKDANGNEQPLSRFTNRNNPYWVTLQRFEHVRRDRLIGNASLRYQFNDWLYVQGRFGQDYYTRPYDYDRPTGTRSIGAVSSGFNGYYYQDETTFRERNMDFLIGGKHEFGKFGVDITLGGNQMEQVYTNIGTSVTSFYVRDLYTIGNGQTKNPFYNYTKKEVNSVYGMAELSYSNFLFLTATARNDWFSTLNPKSNHYLYPSGSLSFVWSELFGSSLPSWLNYGKLRAAYASVGSDTDPYLNSLYYAVNANVFGTSALGNISSNVSPNPNLKPRNVKETELGLELRLFNNRLTLDGAVYSKNTYNDIVKVSISNTSAYSSTVLNLGRVRNQGVEFLLTGIPIKTSKFSWETSFNASYNKSKVISLANGQTTLDVGTGEFFGTMSYEVGKPLASLRGFDYKRDAKGNIVTSNGLFLQGSLKSYGSAIPTWNGGWSNTFTMGKWRLSTQVDFKAGGKLLSNSNLNFLRHGLSKASLVGRDNGVLFNGVNSDGSANSTRVAAETFYTQYRSTGIATPFLYNSSFVRWRSLSLAYDLSKFLNKTFIRNVTVSGSVYNVLMIKKYLDNLDPEASVSASDNLQGIETHTLPTTRSYGLNLNFKF